MSASDERARTMAANDPSPPSAERQQRSLAERIGLCAKCGHVRRIVSSRGADFWQCLRSAEDPSYPRYPRLPVIACNGFEPDEAHTAASHGESGG